MDVRVTSLPNPSLDTTKTVLTQQPREAAGTLGLTLSRTATQAGRGAEMVGRWQGGSEAGGRSSRENRRRQRA